MVLFRNLVGMLAALALVLVGCEGGTHATAGDATGGARLVLATYAGRNMRGEHCPIERTACNQAAAIAGEFLQGDLDPLLGRVVAGEHTCPGPEPLGLGGPYPLCDGADAGERREGYSLTIAFTGLVLSREQYRERLVAWLAAADPAASDGFGSGAAALTSVGCTLPDAELAVPCPGPFSTVFSAIHAADPPAMPRRSVLVFCVDRSSPRSEARITDTVTTNLFRDEVLRGGTVAHAGPGCAAPFSGGVFFRVT